MSDNFSITLDWQEDYEFLIDFQQAGVPDLVTDEPAPLGSGGGPNPARLLAAAVGNCMSASLKFCLDRARAEVLGIRTQVEGTIVRNERGRLRIGQIRVHLQPTVRAEDLGKLGNCMEKFEDYCIVGQSVGQGIDIEVRVDPRVRAAPPITELVGD